MRSRSTGVAVLLVLASLLPATANAQWLDYKAPGIPRLPDEKPNLSAPAPRTADGKPDLNGIWSGAGPMYRYNIAQDLQPGDVQPWAEALFLQRVRESRKDSPLARCMPVSLPYHQFFNLTRLVQTPALMVVLHESPNSPNRTVFLDGRDLPKDPNPTYMGYSVGKWEGDVLVVETRNIKPESVVNGQPLSDEGVLIERFTLADANTLDYRMTINDPKVYVAPWTVRLPIPREDNYGYFEYGCHEGNYAMHNLLSGSRAEEKRRAEAAARGEKIPEYVEPQRGRGAGRGGAAGGGAGRGGRGDN